MLKMTTHIEELKNTIRRLHGVDSTHVGTVSVVETFQGQTVWEGEVEVFDLYGHPKTNRAYAWMNETDDPSKPKRYVTVLNVPPVTSPELAVRAAIVQEHREQQKK